MQFKTVTETAGAEVTREQLDRAFHRYYWAERYCEGKDILEVACGNGHGLGFLQKTARTLLAGDITWELLGYTRSHYGSRIPLHQLDAERLPFRDSTLDVIILFEAIYYLPRAEKFVLECRRVLRKNGVVLISTANKDLFDFNPSPFSQRYYGVVELGELFRGQGATSTFYGTSPLAEISFWQALLRPVKKMAVTLNLIPKSMAGKKFLKRIVFGKLLVAPPEIEGGWSGYREPMLLDPGRPDRAHKIIYCHAQF